MKLTYILFTSVALLLSAAVHAQSKASTKTLQFCSDVGPVELTFQGDSVIGRYQLTVTDDHRKGTLRGTFKDGLFEGWWLDPDGTSRIILGFNPTMTRFTGMYSTSKNHSDWYHQWRAVSLESYPDLKEDRKKDFYCEWDKP